MNIETLELSYIEIILLFITFFIASLALIEWLRNKRVKES